MRQHPTIAELARTRPNGWVEPGPPTYGSRLERILPAVPALPAPTPRWVGLAGALIDEGDTGGARQIVEAGIRAGLTAAELTEESIRKPAAERARGETSAAEVIDRVRDRVLGLEADEALRILVEAAEEADRA